MSLLSFIAMSCSNNGAIPEAQANYQVLSEGDSLTATAANNGFADNWMELLQTQLSGQGKYSGFQNLAYGGDALVESQMLSTTQINAVKAAKASGVTQSWLFMLAGINNIYAGHTPASVYSALQTLHQEYTAYGFKTVAFTLTHSRHESTEANNAAYYTNVGALNALLRTGYNTDLGASVLIDLESDPVFDDYDDPLNTTYFRDKIHYTEAGAARVKDMVVSAMAMLESGTTGIVTFTG